ncbi:MAG: aminotransferase class V-fold PLP-dependent enzyme [Bacillota bacterium]
MKNIDLSSNKITYLDTACMGLIDPEVAEEAKQVIASLQNIHIPPTDFTVHLYSYFARARAEAARLLNVTPEEIALVESTSHGLGLIAGSLPLEKEDNILICDLEFFATTLCWQARREKIPFEIRAVATKDGRVDVSDFAARIDENTKAIVISAVQEINGFRVELQEFSRLAREHGCLLIVDGIQEAGALAVDLGETEVDVYCAGGHKWLRNPFGMGFLYVNRNLLPLLKPDFYSYFNALEPEGGWGEYLESPLRTPFDRLELAETARKFETGGTGNYLGALTLCHSLKKLEETGIKAVEKKVRELGDVLATGLEELGIRLVSPREPRHRSGITSFTLPGGLEEERKLNARLTQEGVFVSLRYTSGVGGIRVSPHCYNSREDIDRLLEITADLLNKNKLLLLRGR